MNWNTQGNQSSANLFSVFFSNQNEGWAIGANGTILKTLDSGSNWIGKPSGTTNTLLSVAFTENTGYSVGLDGTILQSNDMGNNWSSRTTGVTPSLNSVFFINENTGWVAGENGSILKTDDGGVNWIVQNNQISKSLFSIHFTDVNSGCAVGADGTILTTNDGGSTWNLQFGGNEPYFLKSVYFFNPDIGWASGGGFVEGIGGTILNTTDNGLNWNANTNVTNYTLESISFVNANVGWSISVDGTIIKTIDGGVNWNKQTKLPIEGRTIFFVNETTGWAAGFYSNENQYYSSIYKTTDGGLTWDLQFDDLITLKSAYFINSMSGWVVGEAGVILKTADGGETWDRQASGTERGLASVFFIDGKQGWVIGTRGTILKTSTGGDAITGISETSIEQSIPSKYFLSQNYPNPFNPVTTITYLIPKSSFVSLKIYDILGRKVETLVKEFQFEGKFSIHFDAGQLPSGIYFYQLRTGDFIDTKKMVLIE